MTRKCNEGFIQSYLIYTSKQGSPPVFKIWSALGAISAVLKRNVWMESSGAIEQTGYYRLHPNIYMVLVSPAGVGYKSTSIQLALELIEKAEIDINVLQGAITLPRLFSRLAVASGKSPVNVGDLYIHITEFKVLVKGIIRDSALIENLTNMYDGRRCQYETQNMGQYDIKNPCVAIAGASTPEWLSLGSVDVMTGGLGARIIPIAVPDWEQEEFWPTKIQLVLEEEEKLLRDLQSIASLNGSYFVSQETKALFTTWGKTIRKTRNEDRRLDPYYSKKHDLVRKVAMLLAASESDDMAVNTDHIEQSIELFDELEKTMLFAHQGTVASPRLTYLDTVLEDIKNEGELSRRTLLKRFKHCLIGEDFEGIIKQLKEMGEIKEHCTSEGGVGDVVYKYLDSKIEEGD